MGRAHNNKASKASKVLYQRMGSGTDDVPARDGISLFSVAIKAATARNGVGLLELGC